MVQNKAAKNSRIREQKQARLEAAVGLCEQGVRSML